MCGLLLLLFGSGTSKARERNDSLATAKERFNQLGIGLGFQNHLLVDQQKSDLVYTSREYGGGLHYLNRGPRSIYFVQAQVHFGDYFSRDHRDRYLYSETYDIDGNMVRDSVKLRSTLMSTELEFAYTGLFFRKNGYNLGAGPLLRDLIVFPDNNVGLLHSLGLYAQLYAGKNIREKHDLELSLAFPFLGLNTRLPWHNTATEPDQSETKAFFRNGTRVVSVHNFQSVLFRFRYAFHIGKHGMIGLAYSYNWLRVPYHQPMRAFTNTIHIQTAFKF